MLGLVFAWTAAAHIPELYIVGPDDDWCRTVGDAQTGDVLMLLPGDYWGPCEVDGNPPDYPGEIFTIQSFDIYEPARLHAGVGEYVLRLTGQDILLTALSFDGVPEGVDAVVVESVDSIIRFCTFTGVAGRGVVAGKVAQRTTVSDVSFMGGDGTAVEVGCDDGACANMGFVLSDNLVVGVDRGVVVHPGSSGRVADNVLDGGRIGIQVTGGALDDLVTVEGNLIRADTGIVVNGGPALVRSNIVFAGPDALVAGPVGVTDAIRILGNTLIGDRSAFVTEPWDGSGHEVMANATLGATTLPIGAAVGGNVMCDASCWVDVDAFDVYPAPTSPLRKTGAPAPDALVVDWCGRLRGPSPTSGAVEAEGAQGFGPVTFDFKKRFDCALPEPPADTGDTGEPFDTGTSPTESHTGGDTAAPVGDSSGFGDTAPLSDGRGEVTPVAKKDASNRKGCACSTGGAGPIALWFAALLLGLRSRRRP